MKLIIMVSFFLVVCSCASSKRETVRETASNQGSRLGIYCNGETEVLCEEKVKDALNNLGCDLSSASLNCKEVTYDDNETKIACAVENTRLCLEPISDLFGLSASSVYCRGDYVKKSLKRQDKDLSLMWSFGVFRSYVKHICVRKSR